METPSEVKAPRARRKSESKKPREKKERKRKPRLSALNEESPQSRQKVDETEDNQADAVERGLTKEQILQMRALDSDEEDEYGKSLMTSFFGHVHDRDAKLYVENEVSGEFFRVRRRQKPASNMLTRSRTSLRRLSRRRRRDKALAGSDSDEDTSPAVVDLRMLRGVETVVGIMGHGIVVGLSWMDAFNLGASNDRFLKDREKFICTYSGVADRSRIMRRVSEIQLQRPVDDEDERLRKFRTHSLRLLQGAFAATIGALLTQLTASPSALRLATAYADDPTWCEQLESASSTASRALARHQQCAVVNSVLLSLGWLFVCMHCNLGMSSQLSLRRRLVDMHAAMDQLEQRVEHLQGRTLENLSIDELKELIQQHHRAVESTENVLVTKLQMRDPVGMQVSSTWRPERLAGSA